jgi:hypothetical protein
MGKPYKTPAGNGSKFSGCGICHPRVLPSVQAGMFFQFVNMVLFVVLVCSGQLEVRQTSAMPRVADQWWLSVVGHKSGVCVQHAHVDAVIL